MADPRTLVLSWLSTLTRGKPSDAVVTIPVSELLDLEGQLRDSPRGKVSRSRKPKGLTSRSKQRRRPDSAYLAFVRSHKCCWCADDRDVEAHHTGRRGMGQKAPDSTAIPLCGTCHRHFHDHGTLPGISRVATDSVVSRNIEKLQAKWAERNNQGEEF